MLNFSTTVPPVECSTVSEYDCKHYEQLCCKGVCAFTCPCLDFLGCPVNYDCIDGYCTVHEEEETHGFPTGIFAPLVGVGIAIFILFICCRQIQAARSRRQHQQQQAPSVQAPRTGEQHQMHEFPPTLVIEPSTNQNPPPYPAVHQLPTNSTLTDMSDAPPGYDLVMSHPNLFHAPTEQDRNFNRNMNT